MRIGLGGVASLVALALAACGGSSSSAPVGSSDPSSLPPTSSSSAPDPSPPETTRSEPTPSATTDPAAALEKRARAYSDAFLAGEPVKAYAILSDRCHDRVSLSYFTGIVTAASDQYGTALPFETFESEISGDLARATYTYADAPELNQESEPWVRENGAWHEDDC